MPVPSKPLTTTMNNLRDDILQNVILVLWHCTPEFSEHGAQFIRQ